MRVVRELCQSIWKQYEHPHHEEGSFVGRERLQQSLKVYEDMMVLGIVKVKSELPNSPLQ